MTRFVSVIVTTKKAPTARNIVVQGNALGHATHLTKPWPSDFSAKSSPDTF